MKLVKNSVFGNFAGYFKKTPRTKLSYDFQNFATLLSTVMVLGTRKATWVSSPSGLLS